MCRGIRMMDWISVCMETMRPVCAPYRQNGSAWPIDHHPSVIDTTLRRFVESLRAYSINIPYAERIFVSAISTQIRRTEKDCPMWNYAQLTVGCARSVTIIIGAMLMTALAGFLNILVVANQATWISRVWRAAIAAYSLTGLEVNRCAVSNPSATVSTPARLLATALTSEFSAAHTGQAVAA